MRKRGYRLFVSIMLTALFAMGLPAASLAAEGPRVSVPVTVKTEGTLPEKPEEFRILLKADDPANPMPEGSADGEYVLKVKDGGKLPPIVFERVGIYTYRVSQEKGSVADCDYDATVYTLEITITNAEDGGLKSTVILKPGDSADKLPEVVFMNVYKTVVPPAPKPPAPKSPVTPAPTTGDGMPIALYLGMAAVSAFLALRLRKREQAL